MIIPAAHFSQESSRNTPSLVESESNYSSSLKADRPHPRDYPQTPIDYRHTDNHPRPKIKVVGQTVQLWECWRTDRQTDGRYQAHLPASLSYTVDKHTAIEIFWSKFFIVAGGCVLHLALTGSMNFTIEYTKRQHPCAMQGFPAALSIKFSTQAASIWVDMGHPRVWSSLCCNLKQSKTFWNTYKSQHSLYYSFSHTYSTSQQILASSCEFWRIASYESVLGSLVDGGQLRTFLCDPMHTLRSYGYTLSGISIDVLSWSPRTNLPKNAFLQLFFDVINIPIKHSYLWGRGKVLLVKTHQFNHIFR